MAFTEKSKDNLMKSRIWMWTTALCLFATLAIPVSLAEQENLDHRPTFTTFSAPGAGKGPGYGTYSTDINTAGEIVGYFNNADTGGHNFLRSTDGKITTFDAPGSLGGVFGDGINSAGTIAGFTVDAGPDSSLVYYGFLRDPSGKMKKFDFPEGSSLTTQAPAINAAGVVTGSYGDANGEHSFLRAPDGVFTTFDVPGADGTFALGINQHGTITGYDYIADYNPFSIVFHGFLRAKDGTVITFDVPDSLDTFASSINFEGTIAGNYYDANNLSHGYVRDRDGNFTTFDVHGAGTVRGQGTAGFGLAINDAGVATGQYVDASNVSHGFVRDRDGAITRFDVPGAGNAFPVSINAEGMITGTYTDANGTTRGFVRRDHCDRDH